MTRRLTLVASALSLLMLVTPATAQAGAREDMFAAWQKFLALKSFRASINALEPKPMTTRVEFQAPDRYRMVTPASTMVLIGDTAYMTVSGRTMKLPMAMESITAQYRDEAFLRKLQAGMAVEDLGPDVLDGEKVRKVRYVQDVVPPTVPGAPAAPPATGKPDKATTVAWISVRSGLILKLQVSATYAGTPSRSEIRYSGFNDPTINIQPPK